MRPASTTNLGLCYGAGNDGGRSPDEVRIIREMLAAEIETFVQENRVDSRAARELMQEPVHVQITVLDRGALKNCTNPSGAFVARMRDAKKMPPPTPAPPSAPTQPIAGTPMAAGPVAGQPPMGCGVPGACGGPLPAGAPGVGGGAISDVERFVLENRLDQGAANLLRAEPPDNQRKIIALGSVVNAPNPSAAFMIRLRQVQAQSGGGGALPGPPPPGGAGAPMLALPGVSNGGLPPPQMAPNGAPLAPGQQASVGAPAPPAESLNSAKLDQEALKAIMAINAKEGAAVA